MHELKKELEEECLGLATTIYKDIKDPRRIRYHKHLYISLAVLSLIFSALMTYEVYKNELYFLRKSNSLEPITDSCMESCEEYCEGQDSNLRRH